MQNNIRYGVIDSVLFSWALVIAPFQNAWGLLLVVCGLSDSSPNPVLYILLVAIQMGAVLVMTRKEYGKNLIHSQTYRLVALIVAPLLMIFVLRQTVVSLSSLYSLSKVTAAKHSPVQTSPAESVRNATTVIVTELGSKFVTVTRQFLLEVFRVIPTWAWLVAIVVACFTYRSSGVHNHA